MGMFGMGSRKRGQVDEEAVMAIFGCLAVVVIAAVIIMIVVGGIWRTEVVYSLPTTSAPGREASFEERLNAQHWVYGLVKGEQPDTKPLIERNLLPGDQLKELTVITRHTILDYLALGFTLGIYAPVTVDVKGKVIRPVPPPK